jgi:hypothetical protein
LAVWFVVPVKGGGRFKALLVRDLAKGLTDRPECPVSASCIPSRNMVYVFQSSGFEIHNVVPSFIPNAVIE